MKNRDKIIFAVGCFALIIGFTGYLFSKNPPSKVPLRIYFNTIGGPVLFPHKAHTDISQLKYADELNISEMKCADCHHTLIKTNEVKSCDTCHKDEDYSPDDMTHDELLENHPPSCTLCHGAEDGTKVDIRACGDCHTKTGEYKPVSCKRCHQDDDYSPGDMTHQELTDIEAHKCLSCHATRSESDAIHMQCNRCHDKLERCTYASSDSMKGLNAPFACSVCHVKAK